ncbi:MAG: bifunctional pyr operon transcriptional regulator/uracil phosphoribosyltransferase PyrR [Mariprofundaceae bacterium]
MPDTLYDAAAIRRALDTLAEKIQADSASPVCIVGIQRGGAAVADALQQRLEQTGATVERGNLDITFYRDDLDTIGPNPEVHPSDLPFDVSGKEIWLIDDVLYTGRTIRAALGEIFDYGRPASVRLVVLVDRGGCELPIAAYASGLKHETTVGISVKLVYDDANNWRIVQRRIS